MKLKVFAFVFCLFLMNTGLSLYAQTYNKRGAAGIPDPQISQKDNDYIDRQAQVLLDTVTNMLSKNPPSYPESRERGTAKLLMDAVFHETYAVYRKPVQEFFRERVDKVIRELETTKVEKGVRIWKIYNMAFIARTKSVTIAFDLVSGATSGSADFAMSARQMDRLVKQCDALLISHRHEDHADKEIAARFIASGLPVIAPDQVWKDDPIKSNIICPERVAEKTFKLKVKNTVLDLITYPGHQLTSADNNVYLVNTPEGITLAHTGDEINEGEFMMDFEWLDNIGKNYKVDVLMPNAWTMDIFRIVKGFNPALVLPGHEIEMGHPVWDRLPFWGDDKYLELNYAELKRSKYPVVVLVWGESFLFIPKR